MSNDGAKQLIYFLKEDSEKQAKIEDMFLNLMIQMVQSQSIHSAVSSVPYYPSPFLTHLQETALPSQQRALTTNPISESCYSMEWVATQLTADFSKGHNGICF